MHFDRLIVAAIAALALLIGALSVASARLGPNVDTVAMASTLDGTAVNTQIAITFTTAMRDKSVETPSSIIPQCQRRLQLGW